LPSDNIRDQFRNISDRNGIVITADIGGNALPNLTKLHRPILLCQETQYGLK
jgi:hypothetical protein